MSFTTRVFTPRAEGQGPNAEVMAGLAEYPDEIAAGANLFGWRKTTNRITSTVEIVNWFGEHLK